MVDLEAVDHPDDIAELKALIADHYRYTASTVAACILDNWGAVRGKFVKVMPVDYKRALQQMANEEGNKKP
jgi:glutamate synthase (NADPH/NADH) large chain